MCYVVLGDPYAANGKVIQAGATYLIYGRQSGYTNIYLSTMSITQGVAIYGANEGDSSGSSVSSCGECGCVYLCVSVCACEMYECVVCVTGREIQVFLQMIHVGVKLDTSCSVLLQINLLLLGDVNGDGYDDIIIGSLQTNYFYTGTQHK